MDEIFVKEKPVKPKRKLSEKQLAALAKGRIKSAENRKQKKLNIKMEQEGVIMKKEQRAIFRDKVKEQNTLEKIRISEREENKRNKVYMRHERWTETRIFALNKCKTEAQFKQVSDMLDEAEPKDFDNEDGIENRFSKYLNK